MSGSGVTAVNVELRVGAIEESVTVTGESPVVDTQSVRREVVLNNEILSTLPATRGYGSALAAVPALNSGGVAGANAMTAPTTPSMTFFSTHGGASGEGRVMTNGLTVAAPFGGGGVSDVTYDTANAEEMQVLISGGLGEAETGGPSINIVPKSGGNDFRGSAFYSTSGDWATSNNVDDELRALGITQPPTLRTQLGYQLQHGRPDQARSPVVLRQRPRLGQCLGRGRHLRQPLCRRCLALGLRRSISRSSRARRRRARSSPARLTAQVTPRNRVTFSHDYQRRCGGSTLREGGDGCRQAGGDWVASGRTFGADTVSPETFPGYHDFPYNTTQATYSAPVSSRTLIEAGYSRFTYGYARFGMAAPDGLMDLIPVTEQTGIYGRPNFSYRGVFDPLDFGFNDNDALNSSWRAAVSYVTGAHNMKVGYTGIVRRGAQRTRAESHAAPLHVQLRRAGDRRVHDAGRQSSLPGERVVLPVAALGPARSHTDDVVLRTGSVDARQASRCRVASATIARGAGRPPRGTARRETSKLQSAADHVRQHGQRPRLQRHHAAIRRSPTTCSATAGRRSKCKVASISKRPPAMSSTAPTTRRRASSRASGRDRRAARGWTDGNRNFIVDCDLLNPAQQNNLADRR